MSRIKPPKARKKSAAVPVCRHPNCREPAIQCELPLFPEEPPEFLCSEHAEEEGYCGICGIFFLGVSNRFETGPGEGRCDECWDQIREAFDDSDDDSEDYLDYLFD